MNGNWISLCILSLSSLAVCGSSVFAGDALTVLTANCFRCHGQDGNHEGGFGAVLDVATLRERKLIVPGDAETSKLFRRVAKGQMPPADESPRPSPEDVANIKAWIDAGAIAPVANGMGDLMVFDVRPVNP